MNDDFKYNEYQIITKSYPKSEAAFVPPFFPCLDLEGNRYGHFPINEDCVSIGVKIHAIRVDYDPAQPTTKERKYSDDGKGGKSVETVLHNKKADTYGSYVFIPKNKIPEVIEQLQKILDNK